MPISPLYSSREKMVAKVNCPTYNGWSSYTQQAKTTWNWTFTVSTVL